MKNFKLSRNRTHTIARHSSLDWKAKHFLKRKSWSRHQKTPTSHITPLAKKEKKSKRIRSLWYHVSFEIFLSANQQVDQPPPHHHHRHHRLPPSCIIFTSPPNRALLTFFLRTYGIDDDGDDVAASRHFLKRTSLRARSSNLMRYIYVYSIYIHIYRCLHL